MEKLIYLNNLYDLYGDLLTEKQQKYFEDYYFHNLSYGEIALKYNISRNAVFHQLKLLEQKLLFYEEKLNLYAKKQIINDIIIKVDNQKIKKELEEVF